MISAIKISSTALARRSLSTTGSPFRVLGVQQIALGSLELDGLKGLWVDAFRAKEVKRFKSEKENVDGERASSVRMRACVRCCEVQEGGRAARMHLTCHQFRSTPRCRRRDRV